MTAGTQQRDTSTDDLLAPVLAAADLDRLRGAVEAALRSFLTEQRETLASMAAELVPVADEVAVVAGGASPLRSAFAFCGWRALVGAGVSRG